MFRETQINRRMLKNCAGLRRGLARGRETLSPVISFVGVASGGEGVSL